MSVDVNKTFEDDAAFDKAVFELMKSPYADTLRAIMNTSLATYVQSIIGSQSTDAKFREDCYQRIVALQELGQNIDNTVAAHESRVKAKQEQSNDE